MILLDDRLPQEVHQLHRVRIGAEFIGQAILL